jgi:hypothetical protein
VSNPECMECSRGRRREWRAANLEKARERARERARKYRAADPERARKNWRRWRAANLELAREGERERSLRYNKRQAAQRRAGRARSFSTHGRCVRMINERLMALAREPAERRFRSALVRERTSEIARARNH